MMKRDLRFSRRRLAQVHRGRRGAAADAPRRQHRRRLLRRAASSACISWPGPTACSAASTTGPPPATIRPAGRWARWTFRIRAALHERSAAAQRGRLLVHQGHARLGRADGPRLLPRHADRCLLSAALLGDELRPRRRNLGRSIHRHPAPEEGYKGMVSLNQGTFVVEHRSPLLVGARGGRPAESRSQQRLPALLQGRRSRRRRPATGGPAELRRRRRAGRQHEQRSRRASSTMSSRTSTGSRTSSAARTNRASTST